MSAGGPVRRLTCREFVEFLEDYLSGDLPPAQVAVFNAHLARCPSCVSYTKTYRETVRLGQGALRAQDEPLPPEVPEELVRAVLASRVTASPRRHPRG